MKNKKIILAFLLLLAIGGFIVGISLYFQPNQSTFGVLVIVGAALLGTAAFISGLNDAYDLIGKVTRKKESEQYSKTPKEIKNEQSAKSTDKRFATLNTIDVPEIELHAFTSGMGAAGKTTALLNTLSYLSKNTRSRAAIAVLDYGDNSDLSGLWFPNLKVDTRRNYKEAHDVTPLSLSTSTLLIDGYHLQPSKTWKQTRKIIKFYLTKGYKKIIVLIDTGSSLSSFLQYSGSLKDLNLGKQVLFVPWIVWTPNSLLNERYIETILSSISLLDKTAKSDTTINFRIEPIHVFNTLIPSQESTERRFQNIGSLEKYINLPSDGRVDINTFVNKLEFFKLKMVDAPFQMYEEIGNVLNYHYVDRHGIEKRRYSNIFVNPTFDRQFAQFKMQPDIWDATLSKLANMAREKEGLPVEYISILFGKIYNNLETNLSIFYSSLKNAG